MNFDFINVEEANIHGINNPIFLIKGIVREDNYVIEIFEDDEKLSYETLPSLFFNGFCIEAKLKKQSSKIEVYILIDGKKQLICERTNRKSKRIKRKILKIISPFSNFIIKIIIGFKSFVLTLGKGVRFLWKEHHFIVPISLWKKYINDFKVKIKYLIKGSDCYNPFIQNEYLAWLENHSEDNTEQEIFIYNPLISVLIPVFNIKRDLLSACIDSILQQTYKNFEICLVDDCSTLLETKQVLLEYEKKDKRIKVKFRDTNGHISNATNDALEMANGIFVGLVDNDDLLTTDALYENVKALNHDKTIDMIYSDEDKIDLNGKRRDPHFKPDFSPDSLLSSNYICHFTVLRKSIMEKIGGFRVGYEGAQDYDLFLRFTENTNNIYHISKVLYHWRMIPGSTSMAIDNKNYAIERGKLALEDAMKRRNINANVLIHKSVPYYLIDYKYENEPKVSIIIPTKDYPEILKKCLDSIYEKTLYKNYEVVVVNNNSSKPETFSLLDSYKNKYNNFSVLDANFEFNYSKLNNLAVQQTNSDYILLLNNDTEVITDNWLNVMVGYAMQPHIGAVGPKLLFLDHTVQHGGVVVGVGGIANHAFLGEDGTSYGMYGRLSTPYNYSAVTAACLMVSRKKYLEVNGLEEDLMVAYNDIDFNLKLLEAGYYNVFVPQVELYHYESKTRGLDTTGEKYQRFLTEQHYMHKKWGNKIDNDHFYNKNFSLKKCFMLDK
ncbi:MAG: glycosyltransferase [Bacilli bacterium]